MAESLLTDRKCSTAKPKASPYRLNDGGGLALRVMPNGSKFWQFRYRGRERDRTIDSREGRKETTVQLGRYPATSLTEARKLRDKQRATLDRGSDPVVAKRIERATLRRHSAETFGAVANEWLEHRKPDIAPVTYERNAGIVRRILAPTLGKLPIRQVDATALISALRTAESKGLRMSARRARIIAQQVIGYAIATGRAQTNPARDVTKALAERPETKHYAALRADQIAPFLAALDSSGASAVTKAALLLMLYTGLRDGALRGAKWHEINFETATWTVPAERMKRRGNEKRHPHTVPLPTQALTLLQELAKQTNRGPDSFIFASTGTKGFLAENTLRITLHRLGFKVTAHGFRSLLTDELYNAGFRTEWIERQLHHKDKNETRQAYLRTDFYEQRVPMMQWWADYCQSVKAGAGRPPLPGIVTPLQGEATL